MTFVKSTTKAGAPMRINIDSKGRFFDKDIGFYKINICNPQMFDKVSKINH